MRAIFKSVTRILLLLLILLFLVAATWPPIQAAGPTVFGAPAFIPGLLLGTAMMVLVPYITAGLQTVAETGSFEDFPPFDWRYLALFLIPLVGFGISFLTIEGLWEAAHEWGFIHSVAIGYAGVHLTKEVVVGGAAIYRYTAQQRRLRRFLE